MSPPGSDRKPYESPSRRDAARRTRAEVLAAFREMLFADGYRASTIRAVAERAGVSPETIYKTFGGKPGLIKALWDVTLAGDDEPVAMAERAQLREVWATGEPAAKMLLYARFVRGVHERLAALAALLAQAGPEAAAVLEAGERERRIGVGAFVDHLADTGTLRAGADRVHAADACWALTSAALYVQLTTAAAWDAVTYESWLADMLSATLW